MTDVAALADKLEPWWRVVRTLAARYGVATPAMPPRAAMQACAGDMSARNYARDRLEIDTGFTSKCIPTTEEISDGLLKRCRWHYEPLIAVDEDTEVTKRYCPVDGCEEST